MLPGLLPFPPLAKSADDSEYDLTVENVLTAYLDGLLIEKGYSRP